MARRSKAREVALQMLFQRDINPDVDIRDVRNMMGERLGNEDLLDFGWSLFVGVMECAAQLDDAIQQVAENWTLQRMAPTDRNVLRLGAFELLQTDMPHRVVIDEAIELARKFGTAQSPQFVNGILDRLIPDEKRESAGES
ncbi:MAG: transcription antitermination factor NusB [Planctomycetaceae bacterium]|jgi:transcription antitermination protein NusB|nr:transcription antitermination factor NusB [Planctomycetaceae bacterium]MBT6155133.1 transcription antitermination factor NusB [Planctomycetaceae bacterium]MBT6483351.1 transcription antitermination factor NusB [Planctomycetaceae bacterium]MBT6493854.1 transcription antitermination factor NusB [Planctomycetaceae bacterium]